MSEKDLTLFERRLLEAEAVVPVVRAFAKVVGEDKAKEVLRKVNEEKSREAGKLTAQRLGSNSLKAIAEDMATWGQDGSLEEEVIEESENSYTFNVTRCRFTEEYERMGFRDLGFCLSCCRDLTFMEGYNPKIKLRRTQTIMEGGTHCDFHYYVED